MKSGNRGNGDPGEGGPVFLQVGWVTGAEGGGWEKHIGVGLCASLLSWDPTCQQEALVHALASETKFEEWKKNKRKMTFSPSETVAAFPNLRAWNRLNLLSLMECGSNNTALIWRSFI